MRVTLERFAFEQAWPHRDAAFRRRLRERHAVLTACIDRGDNAGSIGAELALHGLVYEASGHRLLQQTWHSLQGRLQLYWAAHHRAHRADGPRRDSHDSYVASALGRDLDAMRDEIAEHMQRGAKTTEAFQLEKKAGDATARSRGRTLHAAPRAAPRAAQHDTRKATRHTAARAASSGAPR